MITQNDITAASNNIYKTREDSFLAGCEHKNKEIEEAAIEFHKWMNRLVDKGKPITYTYKELFKLFQEEKKKC